MAEMAWMTNDPDTLPYPGPAHGGVARGGRLQFRLLLQPGRSMRCWKQARALRLIRTNVRADLYRQVQEIVLRGRAVGHSSPTGSRTR